MRRKKQADVAKAEANARRKKVAEDAAKEHEGSDRKCAICGQTSHHTNTCFELQCNADKRPSNWVSVFE